MKLGCSSLGRETAQEYWDGILSSQKETAQRTEALVTKPFNLLSKEVVLTGAELSEITPNAWKGWVCSRSPPFGRIPGLLCGVFIDFLSLICPSGHQMHTTSVADGLMADLQQERLKWHT